MAKKLSERARLRAHALRWKLLARKLFRELHADTIAASNIVDLYSPRANMYGCFPCPRCKSKFRCQFNNTGNIIHCDDCGFEEPGVDGPEPE